MTGHTTESREARFESHEQWFPRELAAMVLPLLAESFKAGGTAGSFEAFQKKMEPELSRFTAEVSRRTMRSWDGAAATQRGHEKRVSGPSRRQGRRKFHK